MTTISRLQLQGVRSYSDTHPETISFFRPLTIILGNNGCGKTTIIEALKYVTTGTLPPVSDNGKSFVHDPKLESQTSTRAQIRLLFRIQNDTQAVLAVRSFQLTQQRSTRQFKALEGVLKIKELSDGSEKSISQKCVDMDKMVPQLMGVSPAVLENVIFCHQSESDWPLSDSKSLKLKFDDIFSATRYTKAVEVITKLRNEKKNTIKIMEAELKVVETQSTQAKKLREEREQTEQAIATNEEKKTKIEEECAKMEEERRKNAGQLAELNGLKGRVKEKEMMIALMTQEKQRAYEKMRTEIDDSNDQLVRVQSDNQKAVSALQDRIKGQEERTRQLTISVEETDKEYQESVKMIGKYEQQQAELTQKRVELNGMKERMIGQHHVEVKGEEEEGKEGEFLQVMQRVLDRAQNDLRQHKATVSKVDSGFEESVSGLKAREVKVSEQFGFKRQNAARTVARIKELIGRNKEIDGMMDTDEHMAEHEEVMEMERKLNQEGEDSGEPGDQDTRQVMTDKQRQLNSLQAELLVLHEERKKFAHQTDALTLIKHRQAQLTSLINKHNAALSSLLSSHDIVELSLPHILPLPPTTQLSTFVNKSYDSSALHSLYLTDHRSVKSDLRSKADVLASLVNTRSRLTGQLKLLQDELSVIDPQVDAIKRQFLSSDPDTPSIHLAEYRDATQYEEEVEGLQAKLDKLVAENGRNSNTLELLEKYRAKYKEGHSCPLCVRGFNEVEEDEFEMRMEGMIVELKSKLMTDKAERKAAQVKKKMKRMVELSPLFHDYVRLNVKERGEIKEKVERCQREMEEAELKVEEMERAVKKLTGREQRLSELIVTSAEVKRLYGEVQDAVKVVEKEREKLKGERQDGGRELEQVARELEEKEKLRARLQTEVSALQDAMNESMKRREEMTRRYHQLKQKVAESDKWMEERANNEKEVAKLKSQWQEDKDESDKLTAQHQQLKEAIGKQEKEREEQRKKNAEGEAFLQSSLVTLQRDVDSFTKQYEALSSLAAELSTSRSVHSQRDLYDKSNQLKKMREDRDNGVRELTQLKERLTEVQNELLDIEANLEHRKRQYDIAQQQAELSSLQRQLHDLTLDNSFLTQLAQSEKRVERLQTKVSEYRGALTQLRKYHDERTKDLATDIYRNVAQRYASSLIDLQINVMAVKDLDTYTRVLDVSLMHYHTVKMREINDILKDYWRTVYRGSDIEEIYIKSAVETENKRRNYSYSVMMRQGDTDLEMRGRCSAGQRVLASLLIRLALADTFCLQAGMLALDEPTTNLDGKNIAAFAAALADIVEKRRRQSNFQLIVITHDEKFVEEMGRRAGVEEYYRIIKDPHTHYSKIRKEKWNQEREE